MTNSGDKYLTLTITICNTD